MKKIEIDILEKEELIGEGMRRGIMEYLDNPFRPTDLAILTGALIYSHTDSPIKSIKDVECFLLTKSSLENRVVVIETNGSENICNPEYRPNVIVPVLELSDNLFKKETKSIKIGHNKFETIKFGEYPQYIADIVIQKSLENKYRNKMLKPTGRTYTFDSKTPINLETYPNKLTKHIEYEFEGKKYIRIKKNVTKKLNKDFKIELTNGYTVDLYSDEYLWVEVTPVEWLVNRHTNTLISINGLLSGIRFDNKNYEGDFENTEFYNFLNKHMLPDMLQKLKTNKEINESDITIFEAIINEISPEDREEYVAALKILKNEIESLQGKDSEKKLI